MSAGQIHDLGYKRYLGSRRSFGTRWRVIMRHQLATAWRTWWRFKVWLVCAVMATTVSVAFLYFASGKMFRVIGGLGGAQINFADGILPLSTVWYCKIGFAVSLMIGSTTIAGDTQSGAFTFYFARSVRPRDYVLGKLAGLCVLLSLIMLAGPLLLAALRIGLSDDLQQAMTLLPALYKALAVGALGTLAYAAVPFGFSATMTNRWYALGLWAVYYIVIGSMAEGISLVTNPAIAAIDLAASLEAVSLALFDMKWTGRHALEVPLAAALASIAVHVVAAVAVALWRVRNAQQTGVGGAS